MVLVSSSYGFYILFLGTRPRKKDGQKKLDDAIVKSLGNDVKSYLKSRFSLSANMYPHELKF